MDFSAQLNELQQHAAAANDAVKAAAGESRDQVKQRLDMAQADLATAGKNMGNARYAALNAIDARAYADALAANSK